MYQADAEVVALVAMSGIQAAGLLNIPLVQELVLKVPGAVRGFLTIHVPVKRSVLLAAGRQRPNAGKAVRAEIKTVSADGLQRNQSNQNIGVPRNAV